MIDKNTPNPAVLMERLDNLKKTVDEIAAKLERGYVTSDIFNLSLNTISARVSKLESVQNGLIAAVLLGLVNAFINFFVRK